MSQQKLGKSLQDIPFHAIKEGLPVGMDNGMKGTVVFVDHKNDYEQFVVEDGNKFLCIESRSGTMWRFRETT